MPLAATTKVASGDSDGAASRSVVRTASLGTATTTSAAPDTASEMSDVGAICSPSE